VLKRLNIGNQSKFINYSVCESVLSFIQVQLSFIQVQPNTIDLMFICQE